LLGSEQDSVRLNTAKLLLEINNFHSQNINLNIDDVKEKTDEELVYELKTLLASNPDLHEAILNKAEDVTDDDDTLH